MEERDIARLLPGLYQSAVAPGNLLDTAIGVMASLHRTIEDAIADPSVFTDPRRAPDALLPVLAVWLGLAEYLDPRTERSGGGQGRDAPDPGDLRELAVFAAGLGRRRGTADALRRFLELATGVAGFEVSDRVPDAHGRIRPFHIRIVVPPAAQARIGLVERVIAGEKPAFSTFDVIPGAAADAGATQGA